MRKPIHTLNIYVPSSKKKQEIKRKAKLLGKSVSQILLDHFDSISDGK